jgi:XTP/dITP diphosphohydrolase
MSLKQSPRRLERSDKLVVASHNVGKVLEIDDLVRSYGIATASAAVLGLAEPEETGATFAANAELKALAAARASGLPALSDDSGLEVAALGGAPGICSARWAGPAKDFAAAMRRVEDELRSCGATTPDTRRANFTCVLCLAWPDGELRLFEGKVFGRLIWPPRGTMGFGYDPIFLADGGSLTFGEMEPAQKHAISHRAIAFGKFVAGCLA